MNVIEWLLDTDPAIRWQVMRDLTDAPEDLVAAERARVAGEGWGARLLALQRPDGQWHSLGPARQGTLFPAWTSTTWSLVLLRGFGLDPHSAAARHYFGVDVAAIVIRLLGEQMADGGWNCEQENGSTRGSFHTTIDVLEGVLEYERAVGTAPDVTRARLRGQEYLLARRMFRRLSTGQPIDQDRKTNGPAAWTQFSYPAFWHYDVLRGLDYLRAAGATPDDRAAEAIELVRSKRAADGRWALENPHPGDLHFAIDDGAGKPSRWNTLRAMRVLRWYAR